MKSLPIMCEGYILIKPEAVAEKSRGGIVLANPESDTTKIKQGEIVGLGPHQFMGYRISGGGVDRKPSPLAVGQQVLYNTWSGDTVDVEDDSYVIARYEDIFAICNEE